MSDTLPTVKVKASDPEQGAFVIINEADFDPAVHELYVEPTEAAPAEAAPAKASKAKAAKPEADAAQA